MSNLRRNRGNKKAETMCPGLLYHSHFKFGTKTHAYEQSFLGTGAGGGEGRELGTLILEMMNRYDPLRQVKEAAAQSWVDSAAVNASGRFGRWHYRIIYDPTKTVEAVTKIAQQWAEARA